MSFSKLMTYVKQELRISSYIAWLLTKSEYSNLRLGYFWEFFSLAFFVVFLTIVWGRVLDSGGQVDYFFYVLLGFTIWSPMSKCLDQCASIKGRLYTNLKKGGMSIKRQILVEVIGNFLQLFLTLPLVLILTFIVYGFSIFSLVYVFIALLAIFITSLGLIASVGIFAILYEDISRLLRMIMRVAFLMTPVLWSPDMLGEGNEKFIYLNPFFSYLDVFRSASLTGTASSMSVFVMICITLFVSFIAFYVFNKYSLRVLKDVFLDTNV